jgi:hypothetical protein
VAPVQGSAQPSYNNQDSLPGFNKTLIIADKLEPPPAPGYSAFAGST